MLIRIEPDLPRLPSLDLAQTLGILRVYTFTSLHYKRCKICVKNIRDVIPEERTGDKGSDSHRQHASHTVL